MTQLLTGLADHQYASLFSSSPWTEAAARSYGLTASMSASAAHGAVGAAIPFSQVSDLRGERVVADPSRTTATRWSGTTPPGAS